MNGEVKGRKKGTPSRATGMRRIASRIQTVRFQILGIVIASVLIPSFLGGWFASDRIHDLLRDQVYSEIEARTSRLAQQLGAWLNDRSKEVQAFTVSYLLKDNLKTLQTAAPPGTKKEARRTLNSYLDYLLEDNRHFSGIMILDHEGSPLIPRAGTDWQVPDWIGAVPENSQLITEVRTGDAGKLIFMQTVDLGEGLHPDIFVAVMDMDYLRDTMVDLAPEGSVIYLLDSGGLIKAANVRLPGSGKAPDGAVSLDGQGRTRSTYVGLTGTEVIAAASLLEVPRWKLVFETSRKEALLPLVAFRRQIILMALTFAGIFLVPALLLARALVLPLEELSKVSRGIREGQPGLQVGSRIGGELGEFIATFNSMSATLKESLEEITAKSEEMRVMSITDPLTGRYNRRYIEDYLNRELKLASRTGDPLTILMIDLDHFKEYNDTHGHIAGDMVLKELGEVFVATVRKTDIVARYGGEEWIICLSHTGREGGAKTAEKLRKATEGHLFTLKEQETRVTISIGVATAPEDGDDYSDIIEAADSAMYIAKSGGRNRVQIFTGPGSS